MLKILFFVISNYDNSEKKTGNTFFVHAENLRSIYAENQGSAQEKKRTREFQIIKSKISSYFKIIRAFKMSQLQQNTFLSVEKKLYFYCLFITRFRDAMNINI